MLRVIPYQDSSEIYQLGFLSSDQEGETMVVCPNPGIADDFRFKLNKESEQLEANVQVVTISKFRDDLLKTELPDIKFTRKSELLLILAGIWKARFNHLPKETFLQSFQYFTDLRSYTFNIELVDEVLAKLDDTFREVINLFWLVADDENLEIFDEHKAYHLLSNFFRETEKEGNGNLVFYGFTHLSGSQVDFLKSISIKNDVFIPIPMSVIATSKRSDWLNWLEDQDYQDIEDQQTKPKGRELKVVSFQKNRLGEALKNYIGNKDPGFKNNYDIFLSKRNPKYEEFNEIPFEGVDLKTNADILTPSFSFVQDNLRELCDEGGLTPDSTLSFLNDLLLSDKASNKRGLDFKLLKVVDLYKKSLKQMTELSSAFEKIDLFTLYILEEIVQLNMPRVFNFPICHDNLKFKSRGLESLEGFQAENPTLLIAKSGYGKLKSNESVYHEDIMEILSTIGPVRRTEFEYQILKHQLKEVLDSENTILLLEDGLTESDPQWSDVLEDFTLVEEKLPSFSSNTKINDPLKEFKTEYELRGPVYSASKIQSFLECKQKYFFSYINKIDPTVRPKNKLNPNDLGTLEHNIIENYMNEFHGSQEIEFEKLKEIASKSLDSHLEKYGIALESLEYNQYFVELVNFSLTGIKNLLKFKEFDSGCTYRFEVPVTNPKELSITGSIDCIIETDAGLVILDFKRSSGSIPAHKAWLDFEKIQLWFYSIFCGKPADELICVGYINLSHGEESFFHPASGEIASELKKIGLAKIKIKKDVVLLQKVEEFKTFLDQSIQDIESEKSFSPNPLNKSVCTYCHVANLCTRRDVFGEVTEGGEA